MPKPLSNALTPENALIFRVTHVDNVPWLLRNGLHCRNSANLDPNFVAIGLPELIGKRKSREVPISPGGTLSDYVPFYFTPRTPMLYNIRTGYGVEKRPNDELVFLVTALGKLEELSFVFTDSHAYLETARFESNLKRLDIIDWDLIRAGDFQGDPENPGKKERYQAEALIYRHMPATSLWAIACHSEAAQVKVKADIELCGMTLRTEVRPSWYF